MSQFSYCLRAWYPLWCWNWKSLQLLIWALELTTVNLFYIFLIITYILFLLKLESLSGYSIWYKQWSQISDGGWYQRKEPEGMEIFFFHVVLDYLTTWGTSSIVLCTGQQEFCLSLLDGTLPPYHKSEPVPQEVSFIIIFSLDFEFFKRIYLDRIP